MFASLPPRTRRPRLNESDIPDQPAPWLHRHPSKQRASRLLRAGPPASAATGTQCLRFPPSARSLSRPWRPTTPVAAIDARLLTFRARAADQAHAAFTPGTAWPVIGPPARLITREQPDPPLSMPPRFMLTTPQQRTPTPDTRAGRFLERLPGPHLTRSSAPSPCRSPRRSSANAAQGGLTPAPEGRRRRANKPPSLAQHRLYEDVSYMTSSFSVRDTRLSHKAASVRAGEDDSGHGAELHRV